MLKKEEIKNGKLVYNQDGGGSYGYIIDVGNAIEKGDRGISYRKDELSYTVVDILTNEEFDGICEDSGMTSSSFRVATTTELVLFLKEKLGYSLVVLGKAQVEYAQILSIINKYEPINIKSTTILI